MQADARSMHLPAMQLCMVVKCSSLLQPPTQAERLDMNLDVELHAQILAEFATSRGSRTILLQATCAVPSVPCCSLCRHICTLSCEILAWHMS